MLYQVKNGRAYAPPFFVLSVTGTMGMTKRFRFTINIAGATKPFRRPRGSLFIHCSLWPIGPPGTTQAAQAYTTRWRYTQKTPAAKFLR